ncbi:MAG: NUDIX hydrolase [Anaerolineae bacterium]|nr:NUDIX hydrolase [Anaerolineae bacterium]
MQPWKILSRRALLKHSKFLTVESHTVELPNGQIISDWAWLTMPDYVNVAVVTPTGQFLCFRQTKYSVDGLSLAAVGGYCEPGEAPLAAAQRELLEETGYAAPDWVNLGTYIVDGNRGAGQAHLFLATQAYRVTEADADDLEEQELLYLSRAEVETALAVGEFKVLPWSTVMALALLHLSY